jgi:Fe-S-cluster-containing dehydrogenase component
MVLQVDVKSVNGNLRIKAVHIERCIGCYSCALACARFWFKSLSVTKAALRVKTHGGIESGYVVVVCHACEDPPCVRACKVKALVERPNGGCVLKASLCTGCGDCIKACIIRVLVMDPDSNLPIVCTHCGYCAKYCPHGVLALVK